MEKENLEKDDVKTDDEPDSLSKIGKAGLTSEKDIATPLVELTETQQVSVTEEVKKSPVSTERDKGTPNLPAANEAKRSPQRSFQNAELEGIDPRLTTGGTPILAGEELPPITESQEGSLVEGSFVAGSVVEGLVVERSAVEVSAVKGLDDIAPVDVGYVEADEARSANREGFTAQPQEDIAVGLEVETVLEGESGAARQEGDDEGEQTIIVEEQPPDLQAITTEPVADTKRKPQYYYLPEGCRIRPTEIMYKAAARTIQDPTIPLHLRRCAAYIPGTSVRGAQGGSNRQVAEATRRDLLEYRRACSSKWQPNPACTVPMRAKRYAHRSKVRVAAFVEEWRLWEERDKERRDHELALALGYETLVGNLLYIDIPGGNDINRSWQNFLSGDAIEWGFPYEKGSKERPRMKQQEPYLAHQVKEKLWKFPRSRTFQTTQEE